ncbi:MAG: ATP-binding protein [Nitrosomonas sp.]|nr:ATP-binding protein [Nitrosomonas sp.]
MITNATETFNPHPTEQFIGFINKAYAERPGLPESFWHSLLLFNITRITITSGLVILAWSLSFTNLGSYNKTLFFYAAGLHLIISIVFLALSKRRKPGFNEQLTQQVCIDVILICVMIHASGGLTSGLGILLMISLAGAGLISQGRLTLFYAAIASIGILLQEVYTLLVFGTIHAAQFTHAALLSLGYFAVAWLAQRLAARVLASEKLVRERSIDLVSVAQVNHLIIKDLKEGILVVDKYGNIRQCNDHAGRLIHLDSQPDYFHPARLSEHAPELAALLSKQRNHFSADAEPQNLCIHDHPVRVRLVPIPGSRIADAIIYLEDLGHIQAQVQQLKLAALGRLTANIAHEIRNPLSSISHAAELLREEHFNDDTSNRLTRIITDNTQRLNKIVQDVLQLNRRDTARIDYFDLTAFLRTFVGDLCLTEKIDMAVFSLRFIDGVFVHFDRNHLHQILWNLCRNAWRHCLQQKGSIVIQVTQAHNGDHLYLDICDDGAGIAEQQQKQLFEPFFTTAQHGTGLGLYIARELCEANNALLEYIHSATGARFRITCRMNSQPA